MTHDAAVTGDELVARLRRELPRLRRSARCDYSGCSGFSLVRNRVATVVDLLVDCEWTPGMFGFLPPEEDLESILGRGNF